MGMDRRTFESIARSLHPDARLVAVHRFGDDETTGEDSDITHKGIGYGKPVRLTVDTHEGRRDLVVHTARANAYGHDQRADRVAEMLSAFDTFGVIPRHARALDVGLLQGDSVVSLRHAGEAYLVTEYAPGHPYAEDLRRIASSGKLQPGDEDRAVLLATTLVELHGTQRQGKPQPASYTRAIRDLVGSGEGIYGIVDGYPPHTPAAPPERLRAIEERAAGWRWTSRGKEERLVTIHGDFHPFNILFDDAGSLTLLDASRGCRGDAADDVICLAVNFPFFASQHTSSWTSALGVLWHRFWDSYMERTGDTSLLDAAPPYLAWRILVLASPAWYPQLPAATRDRLLSWVESTLEAGRFDPASVEELFS